MSNYEDRRYDRQNEDNNSNSRRGGRKDSRHNDNRSEHREFDSPQSGNNSGDRGYGSDNSWNQNRNSGRNHNDSERNDRNYRHEDQGGNRYQGNRGNESGYGNRNGYGSERGRGNEGHGNENAYGRNRGYGSQYRDENYMDQHYSGNSGRDSQYGSTGSGDNYGRHDSTNFSERNFHQAPRWEGRNDENYNDWSNGTKSRGLGRSETGNNFGESHRGKGPKNYTRSDARIKEDISDALTDHHGIDASDIDIEISSGTVILKGTVDSRSAKRQAEDAVENVSGVNNVENRLHVKSENSSHSGSQNMSTSSHSDSNKSQSQTDKSSSEPNSRSGKISA